MNHLTLQIHSEFLFKLIDILYYINFKKSTFFIKYNEQAKKICFQIFNQKFFYVLKH